MATHAQIAANLLRNAATFFRDIGGQNPALGEQMGMNAQTYDAVADLVERDPMGVMGTPADSDTGPDSSVSAETDGSDTPSA